METRSFEAIHDEYAFFLTHSTEPSRCREEMLRELRAWSPPQDIRLLDFGCSRGEFLSGLLREWAVPRARLAVTAVDIDASALPAAAAAIEPFAATVSTGTSPVGGAFDVILSNHVLYYVQDLEKTVKGLRERLAPGGRMLLLLGGRGNCLCGFWDVAYGDNGAPWNRAEDVELVLRRNGWDFSRIDVLSRLEFPDSRENRLRILRFLFTDSLGKFDVEALLAHFDPYRAGDRIVINNRDVLFVLSAEGG